MREWTVLLVLEVFGVYAGPMVAGVESPFPVLEGCVPRVMNFVSGNELCLMALLESQVVFCVGYLLLPDVSD